LHPGFHNYVHDLNELQLIVGILLEKQALLGLIWCQRAILSLFKNQINEADRLK